MVLKEEIRNRNVQNDNKICQNAVLYTKLNFLFHKLSYGLN